MGSRDSGEEFGQPGARFGAQVLQEFHDVVPGAVAGFVFCRAVEIFSSVSRWGRLLWSY